MLFIKVNCLTLSLVTLLIYLSEATGTFLNGKEFVAKADFKLSQRYENVVSIALRCISNGNSAKPETAYYADAHFTFKQANGTTTGTAHHVFTSEHYSVGIWTPDDKTGIQFSDMSFLSHWNSLHCDMINITTNSKSREESITVLEDEFVTLQCPENDAVLTVTKATYSSVTQPSCFADVRSVVGTLCSQTTSSKSCKFVVSNKQLKRNPCFRQEKELKINYTCTRSDCVMDINGVNGNCSKVSTESLRKTTETPVGIDTSSNKSTIESKLKKHEKIIIELEKQNDLLQLQSDFHDGAWEEQHDFIHEFIVPILLRLSDEIISPKNQQWIKKMTTGLIERNKQSIETYKNLQEITRNASTFQH